MEILVYTLNIFVKYIDILKYKTFFVNKNIQETVVLFRKLAGNLFIVIKCMLNQNSNN